MTPTLSPEAVAQMVADLYARAASRGSCAKMHYTIRDMDCTIKSADMLTTLAAENATLRASEAAAVERVATIEAALSDPIAVHANMLRGTIAMPSFANIKHLYAAEFAALTPTADKEPKT